ncbi:rust resistance kinase Lr10-like [Malania oleifera]|uniref:rust resistance kinase Lr10-like n=1 Tax=Malania oleifera TaxID=397392 RepID=UPI0025AEC511|nr:rust resistance kinase Lr10-like [Malania oleifera]
MGRHFLALDILYLSLFIFFAGLTKTQHYDDCKPSTCGDHGPEIRFPFRLKNRRQPEHCAYPRRDFALSCTNQGDTLLELRLPGVLPIDIIKLVVKEIDYGSQIIHVSDPNDCLPKQLPYLNFSASPFQSFYQHDTYNFSLFNCSYSADRDSMSFYLISCLSTSSHQVYALYSDRYGEELPLLSCKKTGSILGVTYSIFNPQYLLALQWSNPDCRKCEASGKRCRLNDSSIEEPQIQCSDIPKPHYHNKGAAAKLQTAGIVPGSFLLLLIVIGLYYVYSIDKTEREHRAKIEIFLEDYRALKPSRYSYVDIKRITNQFRDKLGQGGYGTVFKGKLSNEILVAVKILNVTKGNGEEFINEVGTMGRIHHVNVVRLVGFCADGFRRALVYEFLVNDSLEKLIFSERNKRSLGWKKLKDIALSIAKGIEYLHHGCDQRILHFDIKPHNVLLDDNFNPKISDFGLAKLCSKEQSAISMTTASLRGTVGYIAPEVFSRNFGNVSYKSDVYSFGMLLLDMVEGRKTTIENSSQGYFPDWIYHRLERGEAIGSGIDNGGDANIATQLTIVGLWCIQWYPVNRPSMKAVIQMLEGEGGDLDMPPNPFGSTNPVTTSTAKLGRTFNTQLAIISETEPEN